MVEDNRDRPPPPVIRYVRETAENWLTVLVEAGGNTGGRPSYLGPVPAAGQRISLPYGLKVKFFPPVPPAAAQSGTTSQGGSTPKRDVFEILEGVNIGVRASVNHDQSGQSYLTGAISHRPAGTATFIRDAQQFFFGGMGPYNTFTGGEFTYGGVRYTPVPPGVYKLAIPAFPSAETRPEYGQWTKYHRTWFRIGLDVSNSRFLHPGTISEGCVTVRPFIFDPNSSQRPPRGFEDLPGKPPPAIGVPLPAPRLRAPVVGWDKIYAYFILARADNQSVGTLTVQ